MQSSRMSPLRRPVSAAKNSVPGSRFGDWFDHCVGSMQFGPDSLHHPVLTNRGNSRRSKEAVSAGIAVAYSERFRSLPTLTVLPGFFELQSQHPKIPFPATEFRDGTGTSRRSEIVRREASSERLPK